MGEAQGGERERGGKWNRSLKKLSSNYLFIRKLLSRPDSRGRGPLERAARRDLMPTLKLFLSPPWSEAIAAEEEGEEDGRRALLAAAENEDLGQVKMNIG